MGLAAYHGQLRQSRAEWQKVAVLAQKANLQESATNALAQQAVWEAVFGQKREAIKTADQALKASDTPSVAQSAAFALVLAGEETRGQQIMNSVASKRPYDTMVQSVQVPLLNAIVALNHGDTAKAIDLLEGASLYARANPAVLYLRGIAYQKAGRADDALQVYQRILDLRAINLADPATSLAILGMARASALKGDKAKSRIAYQDVLALWKDADSDLPLVTQAREEYAKAQ
jgi:tetratricopeptide (TPR) repeat protein